MSNLVQCACGVTLRIRPELLGKTVRCPKCCAEIATDRAVAAGRVVTASPSGAATPNPEEEAKCFAATSVESGLTCPICLSMVHIGEVVRRCGSCDLLHHRECWQEVGGCGTFGCTEAPVVEKPAEDANARQSAWGDTKECPICGEQIKSIALRCRYCDTTFDSVDPLSVADLRRQASAQRQVTSTSHHVVILFIVSILGCLAPIMLVVSLLYMLRNGKMVAKAGPLFAIMGWAAVGLSGLYSLMMLLFYLLTGTG